MFSKPLYPLDAEQQMVVGAAVEEKVAVRPAPREDSEFIELMQQYFRTICQQYQDNMQVSPNVHKESLFNKGIWYPEEYFTRLQEWSETDPLVADALKKFVEDGICHKGMVSSECFERVKGEDGEEKDMQFKIKPNVLPVEALASLEGKLCILSSLLSCQIAAYSALKSLLGNKKFNQLFKNALVLSRPDQVNPLFHLFNIVGIKNATEVKKGDICSFSSIWESEVKHPIGKQVAIHVLCSGEEADRSYLGFGLPATNEGSNREQIEQYLCDELNKEPIAEKMVTPKKWAFILKGFAVDKFKALPVLRNMSNEKFVQSFNRMKYTIEEFRQSKSLKHLNGRKSDGSLDCVVWRPNIEKIETLIKSRDVSKTFAEFVQQSQEVRKKNLPARMSVAKANLRANHRQGYRN